MSVSRIKTIVIAALVLVNAFFLTLILINNYADARDERQMIETACSILQSNGIAINPDSIITSGAFSAMRTARSIEAEEAIAYAFLGQVEMADQGGDIYLYENADRGIAEFSGAGDFDIRLHAGVVGYADGASKTAQEFLRDMKLETSAPTSSLDSDGERILVYSEYMGARIFNCTIEFMFVGDSLQTVRGRYVSNVEPVESGAQISQVGTALLGFLAALKRDEIECREILSVEPGYRHGAAGAFGEGVLNPSWLITTDDGRYLLDSATGEIRNA